MKRVVLILLVMLHCLLVVAGERWNEADPVSPDTYPVPPINEKTLFYIQRSKNTNAIVYEVNTDDNGNLNPVEPVRVFWIRYSSDSTTEGLTYIQKRYAYGLDVIPVKDHKDQFVLNFVSYTRKKIYLFRDSPSGRFHAYTSINGKLSQLDRIFIRINGGTFWFPNIVDIELNGKDPATRTLVREHFKP